MTTRSGLSHVDRSLVAFGAITLGFALHLSDGFYHPSALFLLVIVALAVIAGLTGAGSRVCGPGRESHVIAVLLAGAAANIAALVVSPAGYDLVLPRPLDHPFVLTGLLASAACVGLMAADAKRARTLWLSSLLVLFAALGTWLIRASPDPAIDVMTVQRKAVQAFMRGASPFAISFSNIYNGTSFYAPGAVIDGRVRFGLPYPPMSLLMAVPGQVLLGDLRYSDLAALAIGAGALGYSARGRIAPLAAALIVLTPRILFVLQQGWTESFAIGWLGVTILSFTRGSTTKPFALGGLVSVKQHLALALPFLAWLASPHADRRETRRLVVTSLAVAAAVSLPFVLRDPAGFWHSVVMVQFREPLRLDALSVVSFFARNGWNVPPIVQVLAPLAAFAAGLAITIRWGPRSTSGAATGLGLSFLLLFAFSKKAFCNYYVFVLALLAAGVAAGSDDAGESAAAMEPPARPDPR